MGKTLYNWGISAIPLIAMYLNKSQFNNVVNNWQTFKSTWDKLIMIRYLTFFLDLNTTFVFNFDRERIVGFPEFCMFSNSFFWWGQDWHQCWKYLKIIAWIVVEVNDGKWHQLQWGEYCFRTRTYRNLHIYNSC